MNEIYLGDNEIESIINGGVVNKTLASGEKIAIKQSFVKDLVKPMINNDSKVFNKIEIDNIKLGSIINHNMFSSASN